MPFTRQDIELLLRDFFDFTNEPKYHCDKDEKGQLVKNAEGNYLQTLEWDVRDEKGDYIQKSEVIVWKPIEGRDVFVYLYCFDEHGCLIKDLCYEEWYIENVTDSALILRNTRNIEDETIFEMIPLDRIDQIKIGS